jgi:hypothetical protein
MPTQPHPPGCLFLPTQPPPSGFYAYPAPSSCHAYPPFQLLSLPSPPALVVPIYPDAPLVVTPTQPACCLAPMLPCHPSPCLTVHIIGFYAYPPPPPPPVLAVFLHAAWPQSPPCRPSPQMP